MAERLNRQFPMDRTRQYFTFVYGVFDGSQGRFDYVLAGHPAPILLPRTGPPAPLHGRGLPIGMIEHATFDDETVILQPGIGCTSTRTASSKRWTRRSRSSAPSG